MNKFNQLSAESVESRLAQVRSNELTSVLMDIAKPVRLCLICGQPCGQGAIPFAGEVFCRPQCKATFERNESLY